MPTNDRRHERDGEVPRWAATAGRHRCRAPRWSSRLFCSYHRTTEASEPEVLTSAVCQRALREYHAATLAHARRGSE